MAAVDAGFDIGPVDEDAWLRFNSAGNMATVWLAEADGAYVLAVAPERVAVEVELAYAVDPWTGEHPVEAAEAWRTPSRGSLGEMLLRVAMLGSVLPDQLLHQYNSVIDSEVEKALGESPLERTAQVKQRVGQDLYRKALMQYWKGRCAISGMAIPEFLRASHAKPWRDASDRERLDVHNGLLLAAHLDVAFDQGFISVADDGEVLVSHKLSEKERAVLGLNEPRRIEGLRPEHCAYLAWHRERIWQS
jgi:hypothetical protein